MAGARYPFDRQGASSSVNTTSNNLCTTINNTMMMMQPPHPMIMVRQGPDESGFYSQNDFGNTPGEHYVASRRNPGGMTHILNNIPDGTYHHPY
jgi:hypothetical protein